MQFLLRTPCSVHGSYAVLSASVNAWRCKALANVQASAVTIQHNSTEEKRGPMKLRLKAAAVAFWQPVLLFLAHMPATQRRRQKSTIARKAKTACRAHGAGADRPVRQEFQGQIDGLKTDLATRTRIEAGPAGGSRRAGCSSQGRGRRHAQQQAPLRTRRQFPRCRAR